MCSRNVYDGTTPPSVEPSGPGEGRFLLPWGSNDFSGICRRTVNNVFKYVVYGSSDVTTKRPSFENEVESFEKCGGEKPVVVLRRGRQVDRLPEALFSIWPPVRHAFEGS